MAKTPGPLRGIVADAITPRRESGHEIDIGAALDLIDFLGSNGADGIALLRDTGEFYHFDFDERVRLASLAVKRSRVPIAINVTHSTLETAASLADEAAYAGAAALLVAPPPGPRYAESDLVHFFRRFGEEVMARTPAFIDASGGLSTACVQSLLGSGRFAGAVVGHATFNELTRLMDLTPTAPSQLFIAGQGAMAAPAGSAGVLSSLAGTVPELISAMARLPALLSRASELTLRVEALPVPVGLRSALAVRRINGGPHAIPFSEETRQAISEFEQWFRDWLPATLAECKRA